MYLPALGVRDASLAGKLASSPDRQVPHDGVAVIGATSFMAH